MCLDTIHICWTDIHGKLRSDEYGCCSKHSRTIEHPRLAGVHVSFPMIFEHHRKHQKTFPNRADRCSDKCTAYTGARKCKAVNWTRASRQCTLLADTSFGTVPSTSNAPGDSATLPGSETAVCTNGAYVQNYAYETFSISESIQKATIQYMRDNPPLFELRC